MSPRAVWRRLLFPEDVLGGEDAVAFERECQDADVRVGLVLSATGALVVASFFGVMHRQALDPAFPLPRPAWWVFLNHALPGLLLLLLASAGFTGWALRSGYQGEARKHVTTWASGLILVWVAALSANSQRVSPNISVLTIALLTFAMLLRTRSWIAAAQSVAAMAVVLVGIESWQPDAMVRASSQRMAVIATLYALVCRHVVTRVRISEFVNRREVQRANVRLAQTAAELEASERALLRSKRELEAMNRELERRVEEQVSEIKRHAADVDALNAQLKERVRERSMELSRALAQLGQASGLAPTRFAPGDVLAERIEVVRTLARGGMGDVYEAFDRVSSRSVALKVIQPKVASNVGGLQRFLREATATTRLRHPAIVQIFHVDVTDTGVLYQVLELVRGISLHQELQHTATLPYPVVARLGSITADALAHAHDAGVIHRDIKPANIMLTGEPPGLKLLDFGIAKIRDAAVGDGSMTDAIIGTPAYMAPEQLLDPKAICDRTDVYALALVLIEALVGTHTFRSPSRASHALTSPQEAAALLAQLPVPPEFSALLASCLAKSPAARPSAREVASALEREAQTSAAPPVGAWFSRQQEHRDQATI